MVPRVGYAQWLVRSAVRPKAVPNTEQIPSSPRADRVLRSDPAVAQTLEPAQPKRGGQAFLALGGEFPLRQDDDNAHPRWIGSSRRVCRRPDAIVSLLW